MASVENGEPGHPYSVDRETSHLLPAGWCKRRSSGDEELSLPPRGNEATLTVSA